MSSDPASSSRSLSCSPRFQPGPNYPAYSILVDSSDTKTMNKIISRWRGRRLFLCAILIASLTLITAGMASARDGKDKKPDLRKDYALIFGTVWSADNRPAYGMRVKIRRADEKKARWELTSDHSGEFAQRVPAGTADYIVWVEAPRKKGPAAETKVHIENDERTDIGLHLTE